MIIGQGGYHLPIQSTIHLVQTKLSTHLQMWELGLVICLQPPRWFMAEVRTSWIASYSCTPNPVQVYSGKEKWSSGHWTWGRLQTDPFRTSLCCFVSTGKYFFMCLAVVKGTCSQQAFLPPPHPLHGNPLWSLPWATEEFQAWLLDLSLQPG